MVVLFTLQVLGTSLTELGPFQATVASGPAELTLGSGPPPGLFPSCLPAEELTESLHRVKCWVPGSGQALETREEQPGGTGQGWCVPASRVN